MAVSDAEVVAPAPRVVVIKLGGEVVQSAYMAIIAADVAEMRAAGTPVVIVHGGGPQATDLQKRLGQTPKIIGGRRVTDVDTLEVMKMTVAGKVNVDCCAALLAAGAKPVGLHGASACTVLATRRPPKIVSGGGDEPVDFGFVGDVVGVNEALISLLTHDGYVPVLACLGADQRGGIYNINADAVANQVAIRLDAGALVLVTDVPGVMRDIKDPASRIGRMTLAEGKRAIDEGVVTKGMIPKLEESFAAIAQGVRAVHIVGNLARGDLARAVATPGEVGTVLVA
ncbi:MAG TPA: acetylglutamate kinase [Labilithrix sp.]|nr:acetylglutamate kinase [Labilithrix sp.]